MARTNPQFIVGALLRWFEQNARDLPWRRVSDPYAIWVSEIMLQQTQVRTVLDYWERWMRALPDIQALADADSQKIHKLWEGLGYYTRVRNMQTAARNILERHGGKFPEEFEHVLALPGLGPYTAGAICSIAFNQARPILDGNVIRVLTRLFGVAGNPRQKQVNARLWQIATELVTCAANAGSRPPSTLRSAAVEERLGAVRKARLQPRVARPTLHPRDCSHLNQSLMELGALICRPRQPDCQACPVSAYCRARRQGRIGELPKLAPRSRPTARRFVAFVTERRGRYLVRQRPAGVVNAQLWEFPNIEMTPDIPSVTEAVCRVLGNSSARLEPLCVIRHSITRYRITLTAYRAKLHRLAIRRRCSGRWLLPRQLAQLPFASAHRQIIERANFAKPGL